MKTSRRLVAAAACALLGAAIVAAAPAGVLRWRQGAGEVRALWVTRASLTSPDAVAHVVRAAHGGGFNTLLVQVRGRGDAYYGSAIEPRARELAAHPAFDPLAETLLRAHAVGLQVHAWIAVNLVSSAAELPSSPDHLIYRQPEWLMVPRALAAEMLAVDPRSPEYLGRLSRWTRAHSSDVEGLYMSPVHPAAAVHVADVARDIASAYAVDGVHLDYVRYPNEQFDYSRGALQQFKAYVQPLMPADERRRVDAKEALDPLAYANQYPERWAAFRRSRLTALVMRVRTAVKTVRPSAAISAAVVPDSDQASGTRFQDWRTWLDQDIVDVVCPMAYAQDPDVFARQIAAAQALAGGRPVWAGVGAYRLTPAETVRHIVAARSLGASGVVLFSYDALVSPPNGASTLADVGRAAFGGTD